MLIFKKGFRPHLTEVFTEEHGGREEGEGEEREKKRKRHWKKWK